VRSRGIATLSVLLLAFVVVVVPGAAARTDTADKPIYLVHGHAGGSATDCAQWKTLRDAFRSWGSTGAFKTVAFYYRDQHCNTNISLSGSPAPRHRVVARGAHKRGSHTSNAPIAHLAYHLAWNIYDTYSKRGRPVDVIAHSMGGLIIRYAVAATQRHEFDFPPYLLVEDVVTMGAPHGGLRGYIPQDISAEVNEMTRGSKLLRYLERNAWNPQARDATDWLTMGSAADDAVSVDPEFIRRSEAHDLVPHLHNQAGKVEAEASLVKRCPVAPLELDPCESRVVAGLPHVPLERGQVAADRAVQPLGRDQDPATDAQRLAEVALPEAHGIGVGQRREGAPCAAPRSCRAGVG